jgi:uncharacterized protein YybS (DUF2232 family)
MKAGRDISAKKALPGLLIPFSHFFQRRLRSLTPNPLSASGSFFRMFLIITLFLAASLIPFLGLLFILTLPLLLYANSFLNEPGRTLIAFLAGLCVVLIFLSFMHTVLPLFPLMAMGLAGLLMARVARKNFPVEIVLLVPFLLVLVSVALYFVLGGLYLSLSPWQLVEKHIADAVDMNINLYSQLPLSPEEIKAVADSKPQAIEMFTRIFPALCAIAVLFTIWVNMLLGNQLLRRYGIAPSGLAALAEWKAPHFIVWIFLASAGCILIPHKFASSIGINLCLIAAFIYLLQGLAIVSFFFQSRNIFVFFRWLLYFLIAVQQIVMIAIIAVGFFDLWIDFRKYFRKDQTTES